MRAFAHDRYTYPLPPGHRFPLAKYRLVREAADADPRIEVEDARAAAPEELSLAHDPVYLARIERGELTRREELALGVPWSPELVERARRSVGATLLAAGAALEHGVGANLGGGTHHAFPASGHGYCIFNDVVVATRVASVGRAAAPSPRRRPRRPPGRRHAHRLSRRSRCLHALDQRLRQLPVPPGSGRSRARPAGRRGRRRLPRGSDPRSSRKRSTGRDPSSASTWPAQTPTRETGSVGWP